MTTPQNDFWNDSSLSSRIDESIEKHRKSDSVLRVTDTAGKPLAGVPVNIQQLDTPFHFGANIFMLDGFSSAELNQRYEDAFCSLFNGATVPFYWKELEPEQDKLRFAADSPFMARRPPPDRVVDFCEKRKLRMHGHTLVWNYQRYGIPAWLSDRPETAEPLWIKRIHQIAQRYGTRVPRWDVLNERVASYNAPDGVFFPMPENFERLAFRWAGEAFPKEALFDINEITAAWSHARNHYRDLIRRLLDEGARIDGIGLQFHLFQDSELHAVIGGKLFPPSQLLEALDTFAEFGLPIHVSEITLTSPENTPEGQRLQAQAAASLYRLWFSHPSVRAITWWNVPDGGAIADENKVFSGVLDAQLNPKPAYTALHQLIHKEWRTSLQGVTDQNGCLHFRGFHGRYRATITGAGQPSLATEWHVGQQPQEGTLQLRLA